MHSLKKLQIISLFNHRALKPPRFYWNSPGWDYLAIGVFIPAQGGSCPSEYLLSLAACGTVGSDPGSGRGVGQFHKGGGEENSEVCREKLPWDSHHPTGVRAVCISSTPPQHLPLGGTRNAVLGKDSFLKKEKNRSRTLTLRGDSAPCIKLGIRSGTSLLPGWISPGYPPAVMPPINQNKMDLNDFWLFKTT